jgi:DNA-binding MarR family transcriptional regulator
MGTRTPARRQAHTKSAAADSGAPKPSDLAPELVAGYAIARLARLVARNATRRVAEMLGLTLAEWRVLLVVDGTPAQMEEIARRALLETSHASIAATALVRKGLIRRQPHPGDRRRVHVRRTAAGTRAVRRYLADTADERRALWGVLSRAERRTLVELLNRVIDAAVDGGYEDAMLGKRERARD